MSEADEIRARWRESSHYWEKHRDAIRVMFAPLTRALVEEAQIECGQYLLDVAGGTGEPSLTLAELIGQDGRVICTDVVHEMVVAARSEAARRSLTNMTFAQCSADSLPFDDEVFHATVCRLGAMFFPDPDAAIKEMLRVTTPPGFVSYVVWSSREVNPFFHLITGVLSQLIECPPEDPGAPGAFRFAARGTLAGIVREAGGARVSERVLDFEICPPISADEFCALRVEMSDTLRGKVAGLSAGQRQDFTLGVTDAARAFLRDGQLTFSAQALIVTARKARRK